MIIIDESYIIRSDKLRGRNQKYVLQKDGKRYIYKFQSVNNEIWSELIAEQLGKQVGIEMAHYQLATRNGTIGLLTDHFISPQEYIISSDKLRENAQSIFDENNIPLVLSDNTVYNIVDAAAIYDDRVDVNQLKNELLMRWCFYGLIMEGDKNETNIAFIKGQSALRLSPDFDNASMAGLNKNIQNMIDGIRRGQSIYKYTDNFKSCLKISSEDTGYFLTDFTNFVKLFPDEARTCIEHLKMINLEDAFDIVETANGVQIPWEVKFWLSNTISARLKDMINIYESSKQKTYKKEKNEN
mgnify:CR=1 FL=1